MHSITNVERSRGEPCQSHFSTTLYDPNCQKLDAGIIAKHRDCKIEQISHRIRKKQVTFIAEDFVQIVLAIVYEARKLRKTYENRKSSKTQ